MIRKDGILSSINVLPIRENKTLRRWDYVIMGIAGIMLLSVLVIECIQS
jgi:uncharacterized membrane protein YuzA (DUF378 family)